MGWEGDWACVTGLNESGATVVSESCGIFFLILLVLLCNTISHGGSIAAFDQALFQFKLLVIA